jgi:O-antigen ligase
VVVVVLSVIYFMAGLTAINGDFNKSLVFAVVGVVLGGILVLIALNKFWWFLLIVLFARPALDGLQTGPGYNVGALDAGTAVGAVFLGAAIVWLVIQWRTGQMTRVSRTAKALSVVMLTLIISAFGAHDIRASLVNCTRVLSSLVLLLVFEQIFAKDPERVKPALIALFGGLIIPVSVGIWQAIHSSPSQGYGSASDLSRIDGTFVHPNAFATYLVTLVLLAVGLYPHLNVRWRRAMVAVVLVCGPLIVLTYARGAWIGLMVGLLYLGFVQSPRLVVFLLVGVVVVMLAVPSVSGRIADVGQNEKLQFGAQTTVVEPNSLSWRVDYWGRVLPLLGQNPVTGIGFGMVEKSTPEAAPPHNVFVQVLVEGGIACLVAFLAFLATLVLDFRRARRRATRGFAGGMTVATIAAALAMFTQLFSENLLLGSILWYFLVPVAWVLAVAAGPAGPRPQREVDAPARSDAALVL